MRELGVGGGGKTDGGLVLEGDATDLLLARRLRVRGALTSPSVTLSAGGQTSRQFV